MIRIVCIVILFFLSACAAKPEIYEYRNSYAYKVSRDTRFGEEVKFDSYLFEYAKVVKGYQNKTSELGSDTSIVVPATVAGISTVSSSAIGVVDVSAGLLNLLFWSGTKHYAFHGANFFYWKPVDQGDTAERVDEWVFATFKEAVQEEVRERGLFEGYNAEISKLESEDGFRRVVYNSATNSTTTTYCNVGLYSLDSQYSEKEETPSVLGDGESWQGGGMIFGGCFYRQPTTFFNSFVNKNVPNNFVSYEFWVSLSKRLPPEMFIYLPPPSRKNWCKFSDGRKLMHPVVLNQGKAHWFYPGAE